VVNFQSFSCLVSYFFSICSCRGLIVLLHGLNEHRFEPSYAPFEFILISLALGILTLVYFFQNFDSGRYSDFAKQLNANGFKVYGIDWIGK